MTPVVTYCYRLLLAGLRQDAATVSTEDTGDILVVGLQAGFHDNKALVNLIQPGLQGSNAHVQRSNPLGQPVLHPTDPVGQPGMAPGIGAYDGYDQRYQVYGLFIHLCYLPESVMVPLF